MLLLLLVLLLVLLGQSCCVEELPLPLPLAEELLVALGDAEDVCANACCTPTPPTRAPVANVTATAARLILPLMSLTSLLRRAPANTARLSGSRE